MSVFQIGKNKFDYENVIFIGNDENDVECLKAAGDAGGSCRCSLLHLIHADVVLSRNVEEIWCSS